MDHRRSWRDLDVSRVVGELQTQLSAIAVETAALQESAALIGGTAKHALEGIERSIDAMRRVILDALDVKALEAGELDLIRRPTDLRVVVANAVERIEIGERFRIATQPADAIEVIADEVRVVRAIEALLRAALAASATAAPITLRLDRRSDDAVVSVLAIGMPAARAAYEALGAEEPRADWDADQLALFVARHAIEAHGGSIGVEHVHDIGLRLALSLPLPQSS